MPSYPVYAAFTEITFAAFAKLQARVGDAFVRGELTLDQWKAKREAMKRAIERRLQVLRDNLWPLEPPAVA